MNNWSEVLLKDICDITRGASPRPIHDFMTEDLDGIPWVKIRDATASNTRFIENTKEFIKKEGKNKSVSVISGDLIVSNSATPGLPKIMGIDACIHDGWLLLRNLNGVCKEFLFYLLINDRKQIVSQGTGTVFTNLKTDILKNHQIKLPPISEQEEIASFLGSVDDKIELNQKMNETLEEIAKTLFKSWFIDFDPVRAKAEGRPTELSKEISDLFPDSFEDSELGEIPSGWHTKNLGQILTFLGSGKRPKGGASNTDDQIPSIGAENINFIGNYNYSKEKYVPRNFYENLKEKGISIKDYDILIYKDGANIGRSTIFGKGFPHKECTINEHVHLLRCEREMQKYLYFYLSTEQSQQNLISLNTASAQPGINQTQLKTLNILKPEMKILERFDDLVAPIIDLIFLNCLANKNLSEIRDTLLPKLISGELKIPDAENLVEQAGI